MFSKILPFVAAVLLVVVIAEGTTVHHLSVQLDSANEELSDTREKLASVHEQLEQLESRADDPQKSIEAIRERRSSENIDDAENDADNLKTTLRTRRTTPTTIIRG